MPSSETIELRKVKGVVGEKDDLPSQNPRVSLASRLRALQLREQGVSNLMHMYGAYDLNETLTLDSGEDYVGALCSDGEYLYVGLNETATIGKIVKIDLDTFTKVSTLTLDAGEERIESLVFVGNYLYAGLPTDPGKIVKIDLNTFTKVSTLTLDVGEGYIRTLFSTGSYLYAGMSYSPGKITKIDLDTFTKVSTLTLGAGVGAIYSIFFEGSYLYCAASAAPSKIVKIDLDTFTVLSVLNLDAGENACKTIYVNSSYLYCAMATTPGKVVKIDLDTFTKVSTLTLSVGTNDIYAMFPDGTYMYIAVNTSPGKVVKIDLNTFTEISVTTLATGENNIKHLYSDGTYVYGGLATVPGKIIKQYIMPTPNLYEHKIEFIDEQVHTGTYHVYPTLAGAVTVTSSAVAWTVGNYAEVIPISTIKEQFYLTGIELNNLVINSEYEVTIATGAAASEVDIATKTHETHDTNSSVEKLFSPPIKVSSNTRISAKCATENAAGDTCTVKLNYKT